LVWGGRRKQKQKKQYERKRASNLKWRGGLEGFSTVIYVGGVIDGLDSACDICRFHSTVIIRYGNPTLACSRFNYYAYRQLCSIRFAYEADGKIFFVTSIFFLLFFINLFDNIFILQATVLGHEPSSMELFVEMHVWSDDHQKRVQQFMDSRVQHFVIC
jgi:hypothetical protein